MDVIFAFVLVTNVIKPFWAALQHDSGIKRNQTDGFDSNLLSGQ